MSRDPHSPDSTPVPVDDHGADVAIVGMSCRVPGARSVGEFWRNLRDGVESIREFGEDELREAGVPEADLEDPDYVRRSPVMDDVELFDAGYFGFSPRDAAIMDPQHRHFLECAVEALESAGHVAGRLDGAVGVFAGSGMHGYLIHHLTRNPELMDSVGLFLVRHTGNDKDFLATRVSYELDLTGPSVNVQTACSTSLVAVHLACQSLLGHECDMALAGGVTINLPVVSGYLYRDGEILSPDGRCRAFDARAGGTLFGSGLGIVVLKRLADALRDGDTIHAVVKGSAVNNDGSAKVGYMAPSVDGQAAAIAEAIAMAGVDPETIGYVEAHGTGTAVGDPIEIAALTQAFRTRTARTGFCAIGSVKTNIGHLDTAAGVVGLIKAVESLRHRQIPPSLHYEAPNPALELDDSPFFVNDRLRDWPAPPGSPRRAGVSSLGVGGTNAHVVLEEAPEPQPAPVAEGPELLVVSAQTSGALEAACARLAEHLEEHPEDRLADVAFTLQEGRRAHEHRAAVVAADAHQAVHALRSGDRAVRPTGSAPASPPAVTFLFAGGGAQYPDMGRELYEREPEFRRHVDECLQALAPSLDFDLRELLFPVAEVGAAGEDGDAPGASRPEAPGSDPGVAAPGRRDPELDRARELERPSRALPALFIVQYALARLLISRGVRPRAMIGHSLGEYTAACLAGVFSLADALRLVALRGRLVEGVPAGAMLSAAMSEQALREHLDDRLSVAVVNAPELCVASGPVDAIEELEASLAEREVETRRLHIRGAGHSSMLEPILEEFRAHLGELHYGPPEIPFVSNLSGTWITDDEATRPEYWVEHLRHTVRFADGLDALLREPRRLLVEIGPGRTLTSLAALHPRRGEGHRLVTTLPQADARGDEVAHFLGAMGRCWVAGGEVDLGALRGPGRRRRVPLPTYPFEHRRHWIEPTETTAAATRDPLEHRDPPSEWTFRPTWVEAPPCRAAADGLADRVVWIVAFPGAWADELRDALGEAGARPVLVTLGDRLQVDGASCRVRPGSAADHAAVVPHLLGEAGAPAHVVHAALATSPARQPSLDRLDDDVTRSFDCLRHLVRALGAEDLPDGTRLTVVTRRTEGVGGTEVTDPMGALAAGFAGVVPAELPQLAVQHVDLGEAPPRGWRTGLEIRQLLAELGEADPEPDVAYRGRQRFTRTFQRLRLPGRPGERIREGCTYLVTGGLGGIALAIARHLASIRPVNLVLLARSGLPPRREWEERKAAGPGTDRLVQRIRAIESLEARGAGVEIVVGDVGDADAVAAAVARAHARFGRLDGVLHAAGVLRDAPILLQEPAAAREVLHAKVRGTLALDAVLASSPPDLMVYFSSISAHAGVAGQADYAAANAFLGAYARYRSGRVPGDTIAIDWPAWRDTGMTAALRDAASGSGDAAAPGSGPDRPADREDTAAPGSGPDRPAAREDTAHPLLGRVVETDGAPTVHATAFSVAEHWVVDEHRLASGEALMPGAGYLELARAAFATGADDGGVRLDDVFFVAPFLVPDDGSRTLEIRLEERDGGSEFVVSSGSGDGAVEHARGVIAADPSWRPATHDVAAIRRRCGHRRIDRDAATANPHLRFGPRWSALESIELGDGEALLTLVLPARFEADLEDYRLHPALLDLATAGAQELIEGFDREADLFVPIGCGSLRLVGGLPARVHSHVRYRPPAEGGRGQQIAVFDVAIVDEAGHEVAVVEEFTMQRATDQVRRALASGGAPGAGADGDSILERTLQLGITADEGAEAFLRIVGTPVPPVVVAVAPHDLDATLAALRAPAPSRAAAAGEPLADPELLHAEEVLAEHPALADAALVRHRDAAGDERLVAYVVYDPAHEATVSELRNHMRDRGADAEVPQYFVELNALPRSAEGVDRQALENPFATGDDHVEPATEMERRVARVWSEVLGVERVSRHDNFFDIGGHSLLSIRVITRLDREIGVRLNQAVMVLQTLEQVAGECERRLAGDGAGETRTTEPAART